jgi:hypothetical protein
MGSGWHFGAGHPSSQVRFIIETKTQDYTARDSRIALSISLFNPHEEIKWQDNRMFFPCKAVATRLFSYPDYPIILLFSLFHAHVRRYQASWVLLPV